MTVHRAIPQSWTDYNGHMNEAHYVEVSAQATDRIMEMIGCDAAYIAAGGSSFTVENHFRYMAELMAGETVSVTTQVLGGACKKTHLFHRIARGDGSLAATVETLLPHVDLATRRTAPPAPDVAGRLGVYVRGYADLLHPDGAKHTI